MGEEESFEVLAEVPPGLILTIEQAVGHCNGNIAKTELFKISHTLKDGTVLSTHFERAMVGEKKRLSKPNTYVQNMAFKEESQNDSI